MERNFKGIWIPKEIWLSEELTLQEKVMLVEIDSLDNEDLGCYASNKYFSKFFKLTTQRVSQIINALATKGFISVTYEYQGKEIDKRILRINRPPYPEIEVSNKIDTYQENFREGIKYSKEGYQENFKENNINKNNITKNNINKYFEDDTLNNSINEWFEYKKQRKGKYTEIGKKKLITQIKNNVDKYGVTAVVNLIDECMANNYQGIIFDKLGKPEAKPRFQIESIEERNRRLGI